MTSGASGFVTNFGSRRARWTSFAWAVALGCMAASPPGANAEETAAQFPTRDITIIVPFGAGGTPDAAARMAAAGLSRHFGKAVVVENRPGASTALAAKAVARAEPNGYTLMAVDISFAVTPHIAS